MIVSSFSFLSNPVYSGLQIWDDEEKMSLYFSAIQKIRNKFESCTNNHGGVSSGFGVNPGVNRSWYRTPNYLFLETHSDEPNEEILTRLWTPFGGVELLRNYFKKVGIAVSREFLTLMKQHWDMEEVSKCVKEGTYSNYEVQKGEMVYYRVNYYDPNNCFKKNHHLYLLKRIENQVFFKNSVAATDANLFVYRDTIFSNEFQVKDREMFLKLSNGQNKF